jgi:S-adenosylmethionine:tRNA ribosyltransferase-isomerase
MGRKETGGHVELLVLEHPESPGEGGDTRLCLMRASKRPGKGSLLVLDNGFKARVRDSLKNGMVYATFEGPGDIDSFLDRKGLIPLPPYIKREEGEAAAIGEFDRERYQTVFSSKRGAIAAPTAGLHFTEELLDRLRQRGIEVALITLHVGYGTFRPVRGSDIRRHELGEEFFRIENEAAEKIAATRAGGGRIIAVGTTVVRALETAGCGGAVRPGEGMTGLLITPGYSFKVIDGLITNFHLPKSSLLFLVSAFAGLDNVKKAYQHAVDESYRFYS